MNRYEYYVRGLAMWVLVCSAQSVWGSVTHDGKDPWWLILYLVLAVAFWALLDNSISKRGD